MDWLGDFTEDFSAVPCMFTTHDGTGAPVAPNLAFDAGDVKIYKNGGATEKTTTNGLTMVSPFDSITGLHKLEIDTSNDTGDSGFWTVGAVYTIVLTPPASPAKTVDGKTILSVIGQFGIGLLGNLAAVKTKTDQLVFTAANKVDSNVLALNGDATAAANIAKTTRVIGRGTVDSGATTSSIPTSAFSPSITVNDQLNGRIVTFDADTTTAALRGQSAEITDTTSAGVLTVTPLTTAPASGDTFSVT